MGDGDTGCCVCDTVLYRYSYLEEEIANEALDEVYAASYASGFEPEDLEVYSMDEMIIFALNYMLANIDHMIKGIE